MVSPLLSRGDPAGGTLGPQIDSLDGTIHLDRLPHDYWRIDQEIL